MNLFLWNVDRNKISMLVDKGFFFLACFIEFVQDDDLKCNSKKKGKKKVKTEKRKQAKDWDVKPVTEQWRIPAVKPDSKI